jgi:hypothetical protein
MVEQAGRIASEVDEDMICERQSDVPEEYPGYIRKLTRAGEAIYQALKIGDSKEADECLRYAGYQEKGQRPPVFLADVQQCTTHYFVHWLAHTTVYLSPSRVMCHMSQKDPPEAHYELAQQAMILFPPLRVWSEQRQPIPF